MPDHDEPESSTPDRDWSQLIRRLKALPEAAMRREVLTEQLLEMQPEDALAFFSLVEGGAVRRNPACLVALEAVHAAILQGQEHGPLYELLAEVYRLAREAGNDAVARLMMIARPSRGPLAASEVPQDQELSRLTLGDRKFLARGHDRTRLDRLLFDPEPDVIQNLLRNPHLTEQDIIRLTARRPTRAEIQRAVHESRWGDRYRVRFALVSNPYTPTDLSVKLTGFLLKKELVQVARDGNLHELVRQAARQSLTRRSSSKRQNGDDEDAGDSIEGDPATDDDAEAG